MCLIFLGRLPIVEEFKEMPDWLADPFKLLYFLAVRASKDSLPGLR